MEPTADELAGVVDLFGALTRAELREACSELAFKRGEDLDDVEGAIDDAEASYHLAVVERNGTDLLVPGPAAFPELPEGATDLPHIMDVPERSVDRDRVTAAVEERFREECAVAVRSGNPDFVDRLLDVSYDLDAWGIDVSGARERLESAAEE